jgi:hypothetical protein
MAIAPKQEFLLTISCLETFAQYFHASDTHNFVTEGQGKLVKAKVLLNVDES